MDLSVAGSTFSRLNTSLMIGAGKIVVMLHASWVLSFYLFQMVYWIGIMDMLSSDMRRLRGLR